MPNVVVIFINLCKKQVLELLSHWRETVVTVIFWEVHRKCFGVNLPKINPLGLRNQVQNNSDKLWISIWSSGCLSKLNINSETFGVLFQSKISGFLQRFLIKIINKFYKIRDYKVLVNLVHKLQRNKKLIHNYWSQEI